jgi:hypothetical protein
MAENLAAQMRSVDAVIKMLDSSYSLGAISVKRRKANPWFKRGTVYRPRRGCSQDSHRAHDGAAGCGARLSRRQYRES